MAGAFLIPKERWYLSDEAGESVYTWDGNWLPWDQHPSSDAALFDSAAEAERVQFVLRWANQCHTCIRRVVR